VPVEIGTLKAIFQDHGWAAAACATQMQSIAADVHKFARWMIEPKVTIAGAPFI